MIALTKVLLIILCCATQQKEFTKKTSVSLASFYANKIRSSFCNDFILTFNTQEKFFKIYDGNSLNQIQTIQFQYYADLQEAQFSHNCKFLAISHHLNQELVVYVYGRKQKAFTPDPIYYLPFSYDQNPDIKSIAFSYQDNKIAVSHRLRGIFIFDIPTNHKELMVKQYAAETINPSHIITLLNTYIAIFTLQGNILAGAVPSTKPEIKLFNSSNNWTQIKSIFSPGITIQSLALSKTGNFFLSSGAYSQIIIWDANLYQIIGTLPIAEPITAFHQVQISQNSFYIAAFDGNLVLSWQMEQIKGKYIQNKNPAIQNVIAMSFSPKAGILLTIDKYLNTTLSQNGYSFYNYQINKYSLCPNKTFYVSEFDVCLDCLAQCDDCFGKAKNQCIKCSTGLYNLNGECKACITGCEECTDGTTCNICQPKYFKNGAICDKCANGCLNCVIYSNCTACDEHKNWNKDQTGKCHCMIRHYQFNQSCELCQPGCLNCTPTADRCVECDRANKFNDTNLDFKCECIIGTYFDGNFTCLACQDGCKICADLNDCSTCYKDYQQKDGNCQCKDQSSFSEGYKCTQCISPCKTCKNIDICTSCIQGYTLQNQICSSNGISLLLLIAMAIGGILLLAFIIYLIVKCYKRKLQNRYHRKI